MVFFLLKKKKKAFLKIGTINAYLGTQLGYMTFKSDEHFQLFCCHSRSISCTRTDGQSLVLLCHIFESPVLKAGQELFHYTWVGCWQWSVLNPAIQHISEGRFHSLATSLQCNESHTPEAFTLNSVPGADW